MIKVSYSMHLSGYSTSSGDITHIR